jgi:peroxiredoxin
MVLTASTMLPLGTKAPEINLPDVVSNQRISLADFKDKKALLVIFLCCHCPFVKHLQEGLAKLGKDYLD